MRRGTGARRHRDTVQQVLSFLVPLCLGAAVPGYSQCPNGTPPPCRPARVAAATAPPANSVAVLYFENVARDTADNYIADGLTDEITSRLGQVGRLTVSSRTNVRRLRATAASMSPTDLGRALNVSYLVNGTVRRAGARLRVNVELIRASTGVQAWTSQYDRSVDDLLEVQEQVAVAVAAGIAGQLLPAERAQLTARPTRNAVAYDLYLRASHAFSKQGQEGLQEAITGFEAALRLDPTFTAARGRIAYAYGWAANWDFPMMGVPPDSLVARGLEAADRALREDSMSADAWTGRGMLLFFQPAPAYNAALAALQRAVLLDSGNALAHQNYGTVLRRLGSYDQAQAEYQRGLASGETVMAAQSVSDVGFIFYARRRYREALAWYDSAQALGATHNTWVLKARARLALGDRAGALEDAAMATRVAPPSARIRNEIFVANIEALAGDTARARARLGPALAAVFPATGPLSVRFGYEVVAALAALGETNQALDVLERIQPRGAWLWSYLVWRDFDSLRSHPRFQRVYAEAKPPGAPDPPAIP